MFPEWSGLGVCYTARSNTDLIKQLRRDNINGAGCFLIFTALSGPSINTKTAAVSPISTSPSSTPCIHRSPPLEPRPSLLVSSAFFFFYFFSSSGVQGIFGCQAFRGSSFGNFFGTSAGSSAVGASPEAATAQQGAAVPGLAAAEEEAVAPALAVEPD